MAEHPTEEKVYWLDDPKHVNLVIYVLIGAGVLVTLADFFYTKHAHNSFEEWFGFHSLYGFVGYVFLVLTAGQFRKINMRDLDYYDD